MSRCRSMFPVLFVALLAGCEGGENGSTGVVSPATPQCPLASAWDGMQCVVFGNRSIERMNTPWSESDGQPLTLEVVVYRPLLSGPYPTLIFHHGSTGTGSDPTLYTRTSWVGAVAKEFNERGFMVLFPQRRGRGQSGGIYEEGLEPDRSRYSCRTDLSLIGLEHALEDAEVITQQVLLRDDVDRSRLLIGGQSRGGILALIHAARHSGNYRGVINFVGGWMGEGCANAVRINRPSFASAGILDVPSLWLYGANDSYYSIAHSRANYDAFVAAGGTGDFRVYTPTVPTTDGHSIAYQFPALWRDDMFAFVDSLLGSRLKRMVALDAPIMAGKDAAR